MFNYQGNSQIVYKRNIFIVCSSKRNRLSFIAFFLGGGRGIFLYAVNVALKFRFRYEHTMTR